MSHLPANLAKLTDIVAEYQDKAARIDVAIEEFEKASESLKMAGTIRGTYGRVTINTGHVQARELSESLLRSAWYHVYDGLRIDIIAPVRDKKLFEQAMASPPDFTMENIRATFGGYVADPWANILRGLAEVFSDLDPAYKSHEKVKIGVDGLPKRVIIQNVNNYGWGRERLQNVLNALAAAQRLPLLEYSEISDLFKDGDSLRDKRGVWLKKYANGNGHLFFDTQTLRTINLALAEYYGEVLADCHDEKPSKKQDSKEVSKDLQYYPTPLGVVERVLGDVYIEKGEMVLEPSCGCGRILDALKKVGAKSLGIEVDPERAQKSRLKGHKVLTANFLETIPERKYDKVIMNPPFYGTHYAKHIEHALKFLKSDGSLISILPSTARYDHGIIDSMPFKKTWSDLPSGSFRESGTNIHTSVVRMWT